MLNNNLYSPNMITPKLFTLNLFTKMISFLLGIIFMIVNQDLLLLFIYAVVLLLLIKFSGFHLSDVFIFLRDLWYINLMIFIISLLTWNIYTIVYIMVSLDIVFVYNYFIYKTSSLNELRKCFIVLFTPFKKLKVNPYSVGEGMVGLFSFLPEFVEASKNVVLKEKSKGVDVHHVDIRTKVVAYINMFKKGLYLTQRKLDKQKRIKVFMLFDSNKKQKMNYNRVEIVDILFVLIHIGMFLLIIYKEAIFGEIPFIHFL